MRDCFLICLRYKIEEIEALRLFVVVEVYTCKYKMFLLRKENCGTSQNFPRVTEENHIPLEGFLQIPKYGADV
jgi:hypothetical protein